ncbi:MAG: hypothetical protein QOH41_739 [Blastocatellia bacterium]|nr:hypothetical protein [Blastocatellia bacterium]
MRVRPIRPNIYLPVVRFGVADSDWFSVLLISCAGYLAPVLFGITMLYIPLQMWTWLLATVGSIAFFNYIRIGRKPCWLPHKLKAIFLHHRQYRAIPNGIKRGFKRSWITGPESGFDLPDREPPSITTSFLLEHNYGIQEAGEERWNTLLVTTN